MSSGITRDQGKALLQAARSAIAGKLGIDLPAPDLDDALFRRNLGLFVTLHIRGQLRGCIGTIEPVKSLAEGVRENAVFAAFQDTRFTPLTRDEFERIDIEVSVLTVPEPLAYEGAADLAAKLTPHQDGVVLKKGGARATFLPQVWEQLPEPDTFLAQLCSKAGLAADEWKKGGLEISTYKVAAFSET